MRLRNVKGAKEWVDNHHLVEQKPRKKKGQWARVFGNDHPIYIEIGMGKGDFIIENAKRYPDINFIGIEKFSAVLMRAVEKVEALDAKLPNLILLRFNADDLLDIFEADEINRVYLNFSDPWPKDRWAKRRLTHHGFLDKYRHILVKDGLVQFKTDNNGLFDFSLEEIEASPFEMTKMTRSLHESPYVEGNIMTEYESKFVSEGKPINFVEAQNEKS